MDNSEITPDIFHGLETELKLPACFHRSPLFCLSALFLSELLGAATQRWGATEFFIYKQSLVVLLYFAALFPPITFAALRNHHILMDAERQSCYQISLPPCCFYPQCYYSSLILGGIWGFSHMLILIQGINSSLGRWPASLWRSFSVWSSQHMVSIFVILIKTQRCR